MAFVEVQGEEQERRNFDYLRLPQPGDAVTGVFVKKFDDEGKFGKSTQIMIREETAEGPRNWALRENGDLRAKFARVKVGQVVRVTFVGLGEAIVLRDGTPGNPPNLYRVEVDDGRQAAPSFP